MYLYPNQAPLSRSLFDIPPIWFGLAFLRTRLPCHSPIDVGFGANVPCSDPTTDDKNSRVELAVGT